MVEDIKKMTKILKRNQLVDFAYLFGSRARGSAGERSDGILRYFLVRDRQSFQDGQFFRLKVRYLRQ